MTRHDTLEEVVELHGKVIVSKVSAIVKMRPDGTPKLRIIIDMLRSMVNTYVRLEERIILPRLADMISDLIALSGALEEGKGQYIDMSVLDFSDAFHTIGVAPEELCFQVFKLPGPGLAYTALRCLGAGALHSPGVALQRSWDDQGNRSSILQWPAWKSTSTIPGRRSAARSGKYDATRPS